MVESNQLIFLDTDVLINWLVHEKESRTAKPLWPAVEKILYAVQSKRLKGATSIISIMELRSFLMRRAKIAKTQIEREINMLNSLLNILVPNDITILLANRIQAETALTPIDSIQLAIAQENTPAILISRDKELLRIPKNYIKVSTPERLLAALK